MEAVEHPGRFTWKYFESGPQVWSALIGRTAPGFSLYVLQPHNRIAPCYSRALGKERT